MNHCQVCGRSDLFGIPEFADLGRITSDCKPFPAGGELAECRHCGATQKLPSAGWLAEIGEIYARYTPYHQAEGVEQIVLDSETGTLRRRSEVIVSRLMARRLLPDVGSALDVGCGSGATLRVLSRVLPAWRLFGHEIDAKSRDHLAAIPRFDRLFTGSPAAIDRTFDLVTSIHSLEHFTAPYAVLDELRSKIAPSGRLVVQLYNSAENPFDLLIADHLTHFTPRTLARIVERAGYSVESIDTDWVAKEISLVARVGRSGDTFARYPELRDRRRTVQWLSSVAQDAAARAGKARRFGIFGTSIAATWLAGVLGDNLSFFVDEDHLRQNRVYMGKPVLDPSQVPAGSEVFLALVPKVAANVSRRLSPLGLKLIEPQPMPRD